MSSRAFWSTILVLWLGLFVKEMSRAAPSFYATVILGVLPTSLGMVSALLLPGFLVWAVARAFGGLRESDQARAMVLGGAAVMVVLWFLGITDGR